MGDLLTFPSLIVLLYKNFFLKGFVAFMESCIEELKVRIIETMIQ